jgi:2-methylcitrate dehydratase PrpD
MNGVMAATLAEDGFEGRTDIFEHKRGFCFTFHDNAEPDWDAMEEGLARHAGITHPLGMTLKPYPCCGAAHPSIDAALELRQRHAIDPASIETIDVGSSSLLGRQMVFHDPKLGAEGKFSIEHCVAVAFLNGWPGLQHFTDAYVRDNAVNALRGKVHYFVHPEMAESRAAGAVVTVALKDGRKFEARQAVGRGKNSNPLPEADLLAKFKSNVGLVLGDDVAARLGELLTNLQALPDVLPIAELLLSREVAPQ